MCIPPLFSPPDLKPLNSGAVNGAAPPRSGGSKKSSKASKVVKVALNEEVFRTDDERRLRWSYFSVNMYEICVSNCGSDIM